MTESTWKVVMDQDRVTISGDRFVLTTDESAPDRLDTVVSELQSMARTSYGQYCGVSRAVEMVGERWSLLIIRDLLVSPKSEAELRQGLPLIPAGLLAMRLKEMAYSGVVHTTETPEAGSRYELTEYGHALEEVVLALGRWGAMALAAPRPEDVVTEDAVMTALRASFQPGAAHDVQVCFELHVEGVVVHAVVDHGLLALYRGPTSDADAVIDPGQLLKALLTGEVSTADALAGGQVALTGAPEMLSWFVAMFHVPVLPSPVAA
jgi:DNA-binding HxlR family transcriptional regulator